MENLSALLNFAKETAYLAGRLTLGYFQVGTLPDFKSDDTPVTVADREAEALIRERIEKHYPQHGIVGEEFGNKSQNGSAFCWYIDPIDGTKSFIRGIPNYAVLLGLKVEDRVELGVVFFPALNEMVAAASGLGCSWNGREARVSQESDLRRAFICHADPLNFELYGKGNRWQRLKRATYYRQGCTDAYGHALVATGRSEVMLDPIMSDWDCGPFPVILKEAGGYFGDWQGNETIHGKEALSCNAALKTHVLALCKDE